MKNWLLLSILLPLIGNAQTAGFFNMTATQQLLPGPHVSYTGAFTLFTNPTGTPSTSQSVAVSGSSLTGSGVCTPGSGMEVSLDNSTFHANVTIPNTGTAFTSQPVPLYLRTAGSTGVSSGSGNIAIVTPGIGGVGTVTLNIPYSFVVNPDPLMGPSSPAAITGLTNTLGTQGSPATYTLTWANWTGQNINVAAPAGYVSSQDGTVYNNPIVVTPSGTSGSRTMYVALGTAATTGTHSAANIVHTSIGASNTPYNVSVAGVTSASTVTPDTIGFYMDTTTGAIPGMVEVRGDPSKRLLSGTVPGTTLTWTTVAVNTNNWYQGPSGASILINDGCTPASSATIPTGATKALAEGFYTWNAYTASFPQFISGGWKTDGTTYDIEMSGSTRGDYNINTLGWYNVKGASLQTPFGILNAVNGGVSNTSTKATWTNIAPDASGNFFIYVGVQAGNQAAFLNYVIIRKH